MTVIGTNIASLRATNASSSANQALSTSMERLSTGKRINSAKDDAAGLAISSRMSSQIKSMNVAIRNANDGVSMAQTAEGALSEVTSMLQRMKELSTQSANGTLGASERSALQAEVKQLTSQINDIAKTTNFNGINLLDGSVKDLKLQTGTNAGETVSVSMGNMSAKSLGLAGSGVTGSLTGGRVTAGTTIDATDLAVNGKNLVSGSVTTATADTAKDLAAQINNNSSNSGITATASNTLTTGKVAVGGTTDNDLVINGKAIAGAKDAAALVANINRDAPGVSATLNDNGTITLSNDTGAEIKIGKGTGGDVTKAGFDIAANTSDKTYQGSVSLQSKDGSPVSIALGASGVAADLTAIGLNVGSGDSVTGLAPINGTAMVAGDLTINGTAIGKSDSGSIQDKLKAINAVSDKTGVTATASTTAILKGVTAGASGAITVNGKSVSLGASAITTSAADQQVVAKAINDANTGVTAEYKNGAIVLTSNGGADLTVGKGTTTAGNLADAGNGAGTAIDATGITVKGSITLSTTDGSAISVEGTTAGLAATGLAAAGGNGSAANGSIDISSQASASKAMSAIDKALDQVSAARGDLGAVQNRLQVTVNNLTTTTTNLAESKSRIEDADFSTETTALAKAQILSQASTAMLAQANQSQQGVLKLLQ